MSETKDIELVQTETEAVEVVEKPYTFRLLGAPDIFLMAKIIQKIGINCLPENAFIIVFFKRSKSQTREYGFFSGSSCFIGTKYTHFLLINVAIFFILADIASFEASVIIRGRSPLR